MTARNCVLKLKLKFTSHDSNEIRSPPLCPELIMSDFESVFYAFDPDDFDHLSNLRGPILYTSPPKGKIPILKCSPEILHAIFRFCSWRRGQGLRKINATCRAFRTIVVGNKGFWGAINLVLRGHQKIHVNPNFDCFVGRSAGLHLKIKYHLSNKLLDSIFEVIPKAKFLGLLPKIHSIQLGFLARLCDE